MTTVEKVPATSYQQFMPADRPVQYLAPDGTGVDSAARYAHPSNDRLLEMYRSMVHGRRFDQQATALTKQGRLAVYPSSRGQEACQIAAALCLGEQDWMFPTYRDSMALAARGVDQVELLGMLAGYWHCGYDPTAYKVAPQCTPLATQLLHATGFAYAEAKQGRDTIALAFCGDGATSEGDFHEALNFAAVFRAPVIFLVQNNGFAISVPLARQTAAPSLSHKGVGYGIGSEQVDGNDPIAMMAVMDEAVKYVRAGKGPVVVEAHTYRMDAHTNADDATRYRKADEVQGWLARDPLSRLDSYLEAQGLLTDELREQMTVSADADAAALRAGMNVEQDVDPEDLFRFVYSSPTPGLIEQRNQVAAEIAAGELS
ncbi:pyruvate dehydrogenase (acetyl-transferring) E1 component subunit alpha [Rhodococcus sp. 05-2256-B2]|uniref:pyruvate dehydrogenase (acetyl-transferring) E1 component subunit alpha n=1 Tax=unclassified Rhodococcus (in: high G+C Gram-positive bacteria) TaxID=192944 RepID=UPI000B9B3A7D|nr:MULTISPECIES: pyruvate dehydrogenase (acetyl-transferring) E1 component subunit alpha [unclassified Rhodococcus (in: high G+C Gram-positive bacteria)]OZD84357.1 pyruvate dehydrogenase (acetyl-transferring) E1 component subunit alpha [Rhodococcus sp. 05-2256-B4]OZD89053.1 pyruvate dehydrogenase (acetyl-transferring) E1 component subunit alpha [Rhodococcus sp. 05-2256-B3]OZD93374.1 pyruvate dehydrogenase (acetyl-transferring) E1 component subunit alpha [Rhodococcus sp. 05-2256-B2]OZE03537.1 py